jgi:hypothetical protein
VPDIALALYPSLAENDRTGRLKFRELIERLPFWLEHGVNQVQPAIRISKNMGDEQTLIDLVTFLGALLL